MAFEVEHIIPVSQQGIDAETNLALACRSCNIHKADRIDILDDVTGGKARPKPDEMVMDDENIYWLIWGGEGSPPLPVMFAPKKGGEAKKLTPAYLGRADFPSTRTSFTG